MSLQSNKGEFLIRFVFVYHLSNELRGLILTLDWQQSQAQIKCHELLHAGKVLLTELAILH